MLAKFDEEIKLLENLLKDSKNKDKSQVSNGKHSQLPDSEWVSLTLVETVIVLVLRTKVKWQI